VNSRTSSSNPTKGITYGMEATACIGTSTGMPATQTSTDVVYSVSFNAFFTSINPSNKGAGSGRRRLGTGATAG